MYTHNNVGMVAYRNNSDNHSDNSSSTLWHCSLVHQQDQRFALNGSQRRHGELFKGLTTEKVVGHFGLNNATPKTFKVLCGERRGDGQLKDIQGYFQTFWERSSMFYGQQDVILREEGEGASDTHNTPFCQKDCSSLLLLFIVSQLYFVLKLKNNNLIFVFKIIIYC